MKPLIRAQVSATALRANLASIRARAPHSKVMAVVKANAYGHGLVPTAQALAAADALAVARIGEAIALRDAGVANPIVLLEGVFDAESLAEADRHQFQIVVHEDLQIALLEDCAPGASFVIWLKVDTGMNRLGFRTEDFPAARERLRELGPKVRELRLMTHFACADQRQSGMTALQAERFSQLSRGSGCALSLANSAAIFASPESHADWVRPGIALYGVSPFAGETGASLGLQPAMRLVSTVIALREVPAGEAVGYGCGWRAERPTKIAIVAAGYGDGLPWSLPAGTPVLIGGQSLPLVGRVSMDMIAIDVMRHPVSVGDPVVLWGPELPVEKLAVAARTIPWELLCAVSQRVALAFN